MLLKSLTVAGTQCPGRLEMRGSVGQSRPQGPGRDFGEGALPAAPVSSADRMRVNCSPLTSASGIHEVGHFLFSEGEGGEREKAWGGNLALAEATDDLQSLILPQGCISHRTEKPKACFLVRLQHPHPALSL
ncbi:hypothetical protein PBY51_010942 [Eleginops maclovinus]|uniref:Uncharacterized protein n=1 Tax=Eleginops maclovinus TaxID=56733 RepID=A0AAN7X4W4_ELEMC|nr:hypothetical protein PBY51_010942 [Eleginops maclovinus]